LVLIRNSKKLPWRERERERESELTRERERETLTVAILKQMTLKHVDEQQVYAYQHILKP
jgi:hypothetical protein